MVFVFSVSFSIALLQLLELHAGFFLDCDIAFKRLQMWFNALQIKVYWLIYKQQSIV